MVGGIDMLDAQSCVSSQRETPGIFPKSLFYTALTTKRSFWKNVSKGRASLMW